MLVVGVEFWLELKVFWYFVDKVYVWVFVSVYVVDKVCGWGGVV